MASKPTVPRPRRAPRARQVRGPARRETPVPVVLTRFAAQSLYAPLRTVEPLPGVMRVNLRRDLDLDTLMPTLPVRALALASWRLEDQWVTAVRLTNTSADWVALDPRVLQGDFLTATFQHEALGRSACPRTRPSSTWSRAATAWRSRCCRRFTASTQPCICRSRTATTNVEEADHAQ